MIDTVTFEPILFFTFNGKVWSKGEYTTLSETTCNGYIKCMYAAYAALYSTCACATINNDSVDMNWDNESLKCYRGMYIFQYDMLMGKLWPIGDLTYNSKEHVMS